MDLSVLYSPAQLHAARLLRMGMSHRKAAAVAKLAPSSVDWLLREAAFRREAGYPVAPLKAHWYTTDDGKVWCADCHASPMGQHLPDCRMAA